MGGKRVGRVEIREVVKDARNQEKQHNVETKSQSPGAR